MSQQSDHQGIQPDLLLAVSNNPQASTQELPPIGHSHLVSLQKPPPTGHSRRVSIQEPLPTVHSHRVSIQEPLPTDRSRRVSIQEPPPTDRSRRVSIQEPPPTDRSRRVSIQEPPPIVHSCRASIQESLPTDRSRRVSTQDAPSTFQTRHFSIQTPPSLIHFPLGDIQTSPIVSYSSLTGSQDFQLATQSFHLSTHDPPSLAQANVTVCLSHKQNSNPSIKPVDSIIWSTQEFLKDPGLNSQRIDSNLGGSISSNQSGSYTSSSRSPRHGSRSYSLLPMGCWLLLEAKKISRLLGLVLSLAGMVVIGVITLGKPWIHFHVPLRPAGDPAGPQTILITTIFFLRCPDISCLHEYDQNAYLLDFAWAFFLIASLTSLCLCIALINTIFFNSSTSPIMDFSFFITSTLTVTSMILGVLFYLLQAQEFLQEGMTYRLGWSFYLAWIGIFFFLITGFFSYLNYMNFWSILALQAIWT